MSTGVLSPLGPEGTVVPSTAVLVCINSPAPGPVVKFFLKNLTNASGKKHTRPRENLKKDFGDFELDSDSN